MRRTVIAPEGALTWILLLAMFAWSPIVWGDNLGIHVSGVGHVEVEPDMGHVQLHARREGSDAAALKQELDAVVRAVLAITDDLGIDRKDVTAAAISINPRYQHRNNETIVSGLIGTRTIAVRLRNLDSFGDLMNQSLAKGINNVDPIILDTSRRGVLEDEALSLAMADARAEAARVAAGFEVSLGKVTDVHVTAHTPQPQMARAMMAESADGGAFSPGVIRIERQVQATFAITD